jgi:hypothetical protein
MLWNQSIVRHGSSQSAVQLKSDGQMSVVTRSSNP